MSALAKPELAVVAPFEMDAPRPLGREAFHGILGEIAHENDPYTESSIAAVLLQLIILIGNCIGRSPHFHADSVRHATNENVLIVGPTGDGRKGTSLANSEAFARPVDSQWAKEKIVGGLSSGEGLVHAIRDASETDLGVIDKRLCVVETEFASVLKIMTRKGSTVSELIRQSFDSQNLNILTKNSPARCSHPHVSIIGHITPADLKRHLEDTDVSNGFLNRFPIIYAQRSKLLPEGGRMPDEQFHGFTASLAGAVAFAKKVNLMNRDEAARELWDERYAGLSSSHPGVFGALTSRGAAHVLRFSMIYALMDRSYWIRCEHLLAALEVWRYCEDSVRFIFGDAVGDRVTDEILSALRQSPQGLSRTAIFDVLFRRNQTATKIASALHTLEKLGMARSENLPANGKGRPTEVWLAVDSRRAK